MNTIDATPLNPERDSLLEKLAALTDERIAAYGVHRLCRTCGRDCKVPNMPGLKFACFVRVGSPDEVGKSTKEENDREGQNHADGWAAPVAAHDFNLRK